MRRKLIWAFGAVLFVVLAAFGAKASVRDKTGELLFGGRKSDTLYVTDLYRGYDIVDTFVRVPNVTRERQAEIVEELQRLGWNPRPQPVTTSDYAHGDEYRAPVLCSRRPGYPERVSVTWCRRQVPHSPSDRGWLDITYMRPANWVERSWHWVTSLFSGKRD